MSSYEGMQDAITDSQNVGSNINQVAQQAGAAKPSGATMMPGANTNAVAQQAASVNNKPMDSALLKSKIKEAKDAGHSDADIVGYLANKDPRFSEAKKAGHSDADIISHFVPKSGQEKMASAKAKAEKLIQPENFLPVGEGIKLVEGLAKGVLQKIGPKALQEQVAEAASKLPEGAQRTAREDLAKALEGQTHKQALRTLQNSKYKTTLEDHLKEVEKSTGQAAIEGAKKGATAPLSKAHEASKAAVDKVAPGMSEDAKQIAALAGVAAAHALPHALPASAALAVGGAVTGAAKQAVKNKAKQMMIKDMWATKAEGAQEALTKDTVAQNRTLDALKGIGPKERFVKAQSELLEAWNKNKQSGMHPDQVKKEFNDGLAKVLGDWSKDKNEVADAIKSIEGKSSKAVGPLEKQRGGPKSMTPEQVTRMKALQAKQLESTKGMGDIPSKQQHEARLFISDTIKHLPHRITAALLKLENRESKIKSLMNKGVETDLLKPHLDQVTDLKRLLIRRTLGNKVSGVDDKWLSEELDRQLTRKIEKSKNPFNF